MKQVVSVDIIYDAAWGDSGKGKVSGYLSSFSSTTNSILGTEKKHYE